MSRCAKRAEGGWGSLACEQALLADLGEKFGKRKNELLCEADGGGGMGRVRGKGKPARKAPQTAFLLLLLAGYSGPRSKIQILVCIFRPLIR